MSQIRTSSLVLAAALSLMIMALSGCGDKNSQATLDSSTGKHPADWVPVSHKTAAKANITSCTTCHGEDYSGGIAKVSCSNQPAMTGFTCHATSPAANTTGCTSCHGSSPNGPSGTSAPNRNFAHSRHTALPSLPDGCVTCHLNAGSGTANHAKATASGGFSKATVAFSDFANTAFLATYDPASGTCLNISCHGGQPTPVWTDAPLANPLLAAGDNSLCLKCHTPGTSAGTPQYNSFYSGTSTTNGIPNLHTFHIVGQGANCTDCHNIGKLTDYQLHFGGVATKTLVLPERTIGGSATQIGSYTASTKTCNNVVCHIPFNNFPGKWAQ